MRMGNSRSKNLFLNLIIGYVAQIGILLLSFVSRRVFVQFLSADYLGINGLYGNILSVLALAELGLGSVTQFFFYKPTAEGDFSKTSTLFSFFKKIYVCIAISVLTIGLAFIPFLRFVVNSNLKQNELIVYYVLFLLNSVVTYFSAPQIALLAANQDNRLHKIVTLLTSFCLQIAHIAVLCIWKNYIIYVSITLLSSILSAVVLNSICSKRYPYLKETHKNETVNKKEIISSVKSTFIYKVGTVIVNNTTNILISIIVSTAAVGIYSNYMLVITGIQGFISVITTSITSSVGNLSAAGNKSRMLSVFESMLLIYNFIATVGFIGFFLLFNDFVAFWLGNGFLMNKPEVFAISIGFYITTTISPIWIYREANGLFAKVKYLMVIMALINIVLSVFLGKIWGVFGILIATPISKLLTQVWYEPRILYKAVFDKTQKSYWWLRTKLTSLSGIAVVLSFLVTRKLPSSFVFMIIKGIIIITICLVVFCVGTFRSTAFLEIKDLVKPFANKIIKNRS